MIKLLILDIDGVLTNGTKMYDKNHNVIGKSFMCKDFTAIKRFIAAGIKVILLSGDNFNRTMAEKRNLEFYCTRDSDLNLDKSVFIDKFIKQYNLKEEEIAFVGDDYFDLSMFERLKHVYCPSDSPSIIKQYAEYVLKNKGGEGVIVELYDYFEAKKYLKDASKEKVAELDKKELTSKQMKQIK